MRARLKHYNMVLDGVTTTLMPHGFRRFNAPSEVFKLDFYEGMHYRCISLDALDVLIGKAIAIEQDSAVKARLAHDLMLWQRRLLQNGDNAYIPDSHPWARNTGVLVGINMDAFPPYQRQRSNAKERTVDVSDITVQSVSKIPQLVKAVPLLEIYLTNRAETIDPMHVVWSGDQMIIPDLKFLVLQENKLPECVQVLREAMHELATTSVRFQLSAENIRHEELMQLYGAVPHRVHCMLKNVQTKISLSNQAHVSYNGVVSAIKSSLSAMITGELVHWAMAARSILDLKTQGRQNSQLWVRDWRLFMDFLRRENVLHSMSMLDESNLISFYFAHEDSSLNLELSFQNNATVSRVFVRLARASVLTAFPD